MSVDKSDHRRAEYDAVRELQNCRSVCHPPAETLIGSISPNDLSDVGRWNGNVASRAEMREIQIVRLAHPDPPIAGGLEYGNIGPSVPVIVRGNGPVIRAAKLECGY